MLRQLNQLYGKLKTPYDWQFTEDFSFRATPQFDPSTSPSVEQNVEVDFSQQGNIEIDINKVQGAVAAFLVIRHVYINVRKNRVYHESLKGYSWSNFITHTVPSSAGNDVFTQTISGLPYAMTNLKKLLFSTVTTGISINTVEIKSTVQTEWVNLALAPITAPSGIDMEAIFGGAEGFPAHSRNVTGQGIDIRVTASNTAGNKDYTFVAYGTSDTSQNNQWLVQYRDVTGKLHNIGIYDDSLKAVDFHVDRIIPVPLTDATRQKYGFIVFTPILSGEDYYSTGDQYNIVVNASVAYVMPQDLLDRSPRARLDVYS